MKMTVTFEFEVEDLESFSNNFEIGLKEFIKSTKVKNIISSKVLNEQGYAYICHNYDKHYCDKIKEG